MIDEQYKDLFSQIVQSQISRGKTRLDAKKIADYMSKILGMEITVDALVSSLSNFPFVRDITGNVITVAATPEEDVEELDNEESSDDIHDMAVSQAGKICLKFINHFGHWQKLSSISSLIPELNITQLMFWIKAVMLI